MEHEWLNEFYVIRFYLVCLFVKILLEILSFRVRMTSCMETAEKRRDSVWRGIAFYVKLFMKNYLLCFRLWRMFCSF